MFCQAINLNVAGGDKLYQNKRQIRAQGLPFNPSFFYGWIIVVAAAIGVFFSGPGQTYAISVFINSYITDLGWSRSLISTTYSAASLAAGLCLFIVGRLIDRYGHRVMSLVVGILLGVAALWNSFFFGPVWLFFGFFMLRLFGQGAMTLIPGTLVPQWFIRKRGRALSLMAIGGFASAALFPPLNVWLIGTWGLSATWRIWGFLLLFMFVPISYFLIRNTPEAVGLKPDGIQPLATIRKSGEGKDKGEIPIEYVSENNWTLAQARKTWTFWLILLAASIPPLVNTGLTFHLLLIFAEKAISPHVAALVLSIMALVGIPTSLIAGFIVERVRINIVLAFVFLAEILVLGLLIITNTAAMAVLFGIVWGIAGGFERITIGILWPNYYGRKYLGSIKGVAATAMIIGASLGALPLGLAFDKFGSYNEILLMLMVIPLIGFIFALISPRPEL